MNAHKHAMSDPHVMPWAKKTETEWWPVLSDTHIHCATMLTALIFYPCDWQECKTFRTSHVCQAYIIYTLWVEWRKQSKVLCGYEIYYVSETPFHDAALANGLPMDTTPVACCYGPDRAGGTGYYTTCHPSKPWSWCALLDSTSCLGFHV